jgi:hypothetical protein
MDTGLVNADGSPRPSYTVLRTELRAAHRLIG